MVAKSEEKGMEKSLSEKAATPTDENAPQAPSTSNQAPSDGAPMDIESAKRPAQYIMDRVTGDSYIPREYRKGGSKHGERYLDESGNDPTDWKHRPPHWLCYLPPFVKKFPILLEQNRVCVFLGRIGFHPCFKNHHIARRRLFFIGFTFNFVAFFLMLWACLASSKTYEILTVSSFSRGHSRITDNQNTWLTVNVGFRGIAYNDHYNLTGNANSQSVVSFDEFCDNSGPTNPNNNNTIGDDVTDRFCTDCRSASTSFVFSVIFNMFVIAKNMLSDVNRMYPNYDANCTNTSGSIAGTLSVVLGLYTIWSYQKKCFDNLSAEFDLAYLVQQGAVQPGAHSLSFSFQWERGPGLQCLASATILRFVDALCNYVVPTPSITRYPQEQEEYERMFGEGSEVHDNETDAMVQQKDNAETKDSSDEMIAEKEEKHSGTQPQETINSSDSSDARSQGAGSPKENKSDGNWFLSLFIGQESKGSP